MSNEDLKRLVEERRELYAPVKQLTGQDDFLVSNIEVLRWMGNPEAHFIECKQFFENYSDIDVSKTVKTKPLLYDFHQFLTICHMRGSDCLSNFLECLDDGLLIIGTFHDDLEIAQVCGRKVKVIELGNVIEKLSAPKLAIPSVIEFVEISKTHSGLKPILSKLISVYRLHDPEGNYFSSYLKRMGKIKTSRILYFIIPYPECWSDLELALGAHNKDEIIGYWKHLCYDSPAYVKFSFNIQATVLRIIMLILLFQRRFDSLELWKQSLNEDVLLPGHDGNSKGFNAETLKMLDTIEKNKKWIT